MKTEIKTSLDIVQDWRRNTKIAYDKWLNVADEIAWLVQTIKTLKDPELINVDIGDALGFLEERLAQLKSATQQDGDAD